MPLANSRDKRTQVVWGIKDFEFRFKRQPEGMWIPENAADLETLDIVADCGIKYTILAPHQAKRVKKIKGGDWADVNEGKIDPKIPYLCRLPSGKTITIFFFDGPISHDLAFSKLLDKGENFAKRMVGAFAEIKGNQLVHVAVDGETFGHHHRFGDMALAYCLHYIESNKLAKITIYGEYLEKNPPAHEVEIFESSSWSCAHGIERWRNDCGCCTGGHPKWNQKWRAPLRGAMDWLRDTLIQLYEEAMTGLVRDPWKARDDYIGIILDRSHENLENFFSRHSDRKLSEEEKVRILNLLEMERHLMLMYTSCGWFSDEVSGIESVQIMQYASRSMQLAKIIGDLSLEDAYINILERVPSNIPEFKNGARIYEMLVKPFVVDFMRLGAHYAISSLFNDYPDVADIFCYKAVREVYDKAEVGKQKVAIGKVRLDSVINLEEACISFAVLHLGDHNIVCGVRFFVDEESFQQMRREIKEAFSRSEISEVMRLIDKHFGKNNYSLWHLFKDEQSKILKQIFGAALLDMESSFRNIKENHYPVMHTMRELRIPFPKVFTSIVEYVLNADIHRLIDSERIDVNHLKKIVDEAKKWGVKIDKEELAFLVSRKVNTLMFELKKNPHDLFLLQRMEAALSFLDIFPLDLNLWKSQNTLFAVSKSHYNEMFAEAERGNDEAKEWIDCFGRISAYMGLKTV
ncbi:DUF3536 domain-containing protein, partial [Candidatus Auribacterota bacterium]